MLDLTPNTISYIALKSYLTADHTCGDLQLLLAEIVQICTITLCTFVQERAASTPKVCTTTK